MEVLQNTVSEPIDLAPCSVCGRSFNPEVLVRHTRICSKNKQHTQKRPVFDMAKKRAEGTELQAFLASRPFLKSKKPSSAEVKAAEKKKNWRRRHDEFIAALRSAKEYTEAEAKGGPVPPPRPSAPNPDYVQCPHCERRFEQYSAERHIPFCKEQHSRLERKPESNKPKQSLNKRIQYKPPSLKKKGSNTQQQSHISTKPPPGYHLIPKNTNFSATYNVENGASPRYYRTSHQQGKTVGGGSGGRGPVVKSTVPEPSSHHRLSSNPSATTAGDLPGNGHQSRRNEPIIKRTSFGRSHLVMEGESSGRSGGGGIHRTSRLKTPQGIVAAYRESQMRKAAGYEHVDSNQQSSNGYAERRGMVQLQNEVRQYDDSERSSSSSFGDGESVVPPVKLGPIKPKGKSSIRRARVPEVFPISQDSTTSNQTRPDPSSTELLTGIGSGSRMNSSRGVPLNEHGMTMGKFCYECGSKYPVPQAKYCCECGTKRI